MKLSEIISERRKQQNLTYDDLSTKVTALRGTHVSKSKIGTLFTEIPWDDLDALFEILELKTVDSADVCVPPETYKALKSMAKLGIDYL